MVKVAWVKFQTKHHKYMQFTVHQYYLKTNKQTKTRGKDLSLRKGGSIPASQ